MNLKESMKKRRDLDEAGFSLIEVIGAIVILGISFLLIASLVIQNNYAINFNKQQEEAIAARDDIKEWLLYKAQIQDIANLNPWVFTEPSHAESTAMQQRRNHLVVDNSGIQYAQGQPLYGETPIDIEDDLRGTFIRKVEYKFDGDELPENLAYSEYAPFYIGHYLSENGEATDYLVKILVEQDTTSADFDPRRQGVRLIIQIYGKARGDLLTETILNWVIEY